MNKDKQILIRVSETEKADFEKAAEIAGVGLSGWARQCLRSAAISELQKIGETPVFLKPAQK